MYTGWFFGMIIGTNSVNWSLVSSALGPRFSRTCSILQPFRVAPMLDNPWLIGLSWLVCIPIPVYATLSTLETKMRKNSPDQQRQKQQQTIDII